MDPNSQRLMMGAAGGGAAAPVVLESGIAGTFSVNFTTTPSANTLILAFLYRGGADPQLPAGYTNIALVNSNNARFRVAYKVAVGNETSVSGGNGEVAGYAFVTIGSTLDATGTSASSSGTAVAVPGITPNNPSLVFLVSGLNSNATATPTLNDTGWTSLLDSATQLSTTRELAVWTKTGTGSSTATVTVTWTSSVTSGVQFSVK